MQKDQWRWPNSAPRLPPSSDVADAADGADGISETRAHSDYPASGVAFTTEANLDAERS
jgi:hypothetical protein